MPLPSRPAFAKKARSAVFTHTPFLTAALALLAALTLAACNDSNTNLKALTLAPDSTTLVEGKTKQFTATGIYDDDTTADFTTGVYWSSASPGIVSIDQDGLATAVAAGQTTVSATDGVTGVFDSASVTVEPAPPAPEKTPAAFAGESFSVTVNGAEITLYEAASANPIGYDPWVYAEYDATTGGTLISARLNYNSSFSFFDDSIELVFEGQSAGSYDYPASGNTRSYYRLDGLSYEPDFAAPVNSTVALTVDAIGAVGEPVTGTFSAVLCDAATVMAESAGNECGAPANQITLTAGAFATSREPDLGSQDNPKYLDRDFGPRTHRLDADHGPANFYVLYDVTPGRIYTVAIRQMDEDLTLVAYGGDSTFSAPIVCDLLDDTGKPNTEPEKCVLTAGSSDSELYFKVVRENTTPVGLAFYDIEGKTVPPGVDLSIEIVAIVDTPGGFPDVIGYRVTNNGDTVSTSSFTVDFYEAPTNPPVPGQAWDANTVVSATIAPFGGTYTDAFSHAIAATGSTAYVTVDGGLAIPEGEETNNTSPPFNWGTQGRPFFITTFANAGGCCTDTVLDLGTLDAPAPLASNDDGGRDPANGYSGMKLYSHPGARLLFRVGANAGPGVRPYSIVISESGFGSGTSPGNPGVPDSGEPDNNPPDGKPLFLDAVLDRTLDPSPPADIDDFFLFDVPF